MEREEAEEVTVEREEAEEVTVEREEAGDSGKDGGGLDLEYLHRPKPVRRRRQQQNFSKPILYCKKWIQKPEVVRLFVSRDKSTLMYGMQLGSAF